MGVTHECETQRVLPNVQRIRAGQNVGASRVGKRSFRRAQGRAARTGRALYRGKWYTAKQLGVSMSTPMQPKISSWQQTSSWQQQFSKRIKLGEAQRAGHLKCFSWNCGGLPIHKWDELVAFFEDEQIDVAFLQETRWRHQSDWIAGRYYCIHCGEKKTSGNAWNGVLTLISRRLTSEHLIRHSSILDGHILHVRFPTSSANVDLINVYQQAFGVSQRIQEHREQVWDALGAVLCRVPLRNILLLGGDFNAPLLERHPHIGRAFCSPPQHFRQENDRIGDLIECHDLIVLNSWQGTDQVTCYTAQNGRSCIDGLLIRRLHADVVSRQARFPKEISLY